MEEANYGSKNEERKGKKKNRIEELNMGGWGLKGCEGKRVQRSLDEFDWIKG